MIQYAKCKEAIADICQSKLKHKDYNKKKFATVPFCIHFVARIFSLTIDNSIIIVQLNKIIHFERNSFFYLDYIPTRTSIKCLVS